MSLIEKLLGFYEEHSKTLVVVLFGLIVSGATGGGLWINSLKSSLEQQKIIASDARKLVEERYLTTIVQAASDHKKVVESHKNLYKQLNTSTQKIRSIAEDLDRRLSSSNLSKTRAELKQDLLHEIEAMEKVTEENQKPTTTNMDRLISKAEAYSYPDKINSLPSFNGFNPWRTYLFYLTILLIFTFISLVLWRITVSRKKQEDETSNTDE